MNKRVHEIAKERGMSSKDVLARLQAAGVEVKAASSNVDADVASRVLSDGGGPAEPAAAPSAAVQNAEVPAQPAAAPPAAPAQAAPQAVADPAPEASAQSTSAKPAEHKRPTRDSLQGERAPGAAGGR